jgi:hypothetical protein
VNNKEEFMSLKERRMLEELEGDSLLSKPRWFVKDAQSLNEAESTETTVEVEEVAIK